MAKKNEDTTYVPTDDFAAGVAEEAATGNVENHPEAFKFEKAGDFIIGRVTGFAQGRHTKYGPYPIIRIASEIHGAERSVHVFHTALLSRLEAEAVETGDRVAITRGQDRTGEGPDANTYATYAVRVDRESSRAQTFGEFAAMARGDSGGS